MHVDIGAQGFLPADQLYRLLSCARCVWPTAAEAVLASGSSGNSGIVITVESERGSTSSLNSIASKTTPRLSPERLKRLREASGNCYSQNHVIWLFFFFSFFSFSFFFFCIIASQRVKRFR